MDYREYNKGLLDYINQSPTAFHAAANAADMLEEAGFKRLDEKQPWKPEAGGKYYISRSSTSLLAFIVGTESPAEAGFRIIGSHTDFPSFKIKPGRATVSPDGYVQLNTEPYGGMILNTWLDRPLSIAGRVLLDSGDAFSPEERLVNLNKALLMIPNLCIHFNRDVNEKASLDRQAHMMPIASMEKDREADKDYILALLEKELSVERGEILDYDLYACDYSPGMAMGMEDEFISASGLDNLAMVYNSLLAFIDSGEAGDGCRVFAAFDNEEVGSMMPAGANSSFLSQSLERFSMGLGCVGEDYQRALVSSFFISADAVHGVHPNYAQKHDPTNRPVLGKGPVIKYSASQRYATNGASAAVFKKICEKAGVPCQSFVNRSDTPGGSTIGPIVASLSSIQAVDVGSCVLAMHSIREFASSADNVYCYKAFKEFYGF